MIYFSGGHELRTRDLFNPVQEQYTKLKFEQDILHILLVAVWLIDQSNALTLPMQYVQIFHYFRQPKIEKNMIYNICSQTCIKWSPLRERQKWSYKTGDLLK